MAQTQNATIPPLASRPAPPFVELQQCLPSRVAAISPSVNQLLRFVKLFMCKFRAADGIEADIEIALHEALANAVIHGNHEDPHKRVYVSCRCSVDGQVSIMLRNEGQGFDTSAVPHPTDPNNEFLTPRSGIRLMRELMDELWFEEQGKVVRMRKVLPRQLYL